MLRMTGVVSFELIKEFDDNHRIKDTNVKRDAAVAYKHYFLQSLSQEHATASITFTKGMVVASQAVATKIDSFPACSFFFLICCFSLFWKTI